MHGEPVPSPRIAVVIPTLDEESTLAACLEAIGRRTGVEVVVSDGGSSDRTVAIAVAHGCTVVEGPSGRGQQLDRGARATRAPLLLFVHADCRLPGGWLEAVEQALARPGAALVCFRLHTEPAGPAGGWRRWWLRLADLRSFGLGLPYGDQAFGVRRELYRAVGGFPPIPLMEDLAFARSCARRGRIVRLSAAVRTRARRVERHPVRTRLMTAAFPWLYRLGVPAERLARWYGKVR